MHYKGWPELWVHACEGEIQLSAVSERTVMGKQRAKFLESVQNIWNYELQKKMSSVNLMVIKVFSRQILLCFSRHTKNTLSAERRLKKTTLFPKFSDSELGLKKKPTLILRFRAHSWLQVWAEWPSQGRISNILPVRILPKIFFFLLQT